MGQVEGGTDGATGRTAFMVEAYRGRGGPDDVEPSGMPPSAVGVIDIPTDETTLFVLVTSDATAAADEVRHLGFQTIRVIDVRWSVTLPSADDRDTVEDGRTHP